MSNDLESCHIDKACMFVAKASHVIFVCCGNEERFQRLVNLIVLQVFRALFLVLTGISTITRPALPSWIMGSGPGFTGGDTFYGGQRVANF